MTDQHHTPRIPNADYTPYTAFTLEPNHPSEVNFGELKLVLGKQSMSHAHVVSREDALRLAISILDTLADEVQGPEEGETTAAVNRVEEYLRQFEKQTSVDTSVIHTIWTDPEVESAPLRPLDIRTIIRAARA